MATTHVSTKNIDLLCSFSLNQRSDPKMRRGTWTREEEVYVAALIHEFKEGHLLVKEGTSLRSFLSKIVRCNPKRISKKFEGSNYNGKQLYEQSEAQLDSAEALKRRMKLQEMENKFEDSVTALQAAEDSRKTGFDSSYGMGMGMASSSDRINLFSSAHHQPSLFAGAGGLSGLSHDANWLRGSLAAAASAGSMRLGAAGLGMSGLDPMMTRHSDGALLDMVRMSKGLSVGMDSIGDSSLLNSLSDPSLARYLPQGLSPWGSLGAPSGLHSSLGFPSSSLGSEEALHQELLHQQLSAMAPSAAAHPQSLLDDEFSRRRFMDMLSNQSETSSKRPSALLSTTDVADLVDASKKRRLY